MRMEDLDPDRSRAIYAEAALEDLRWLGIRWQEGPNEGGPYTPYVQSERRAIYLATWRTLLRRGYLFPCRCSRKDLATALSAPHEGSSQASPRRTEKLEPLDDEPIYPGTCRQFQAHATQIPGQTAGGVETPEGFNWRFRVPDGEPIEFVDGNLGPQRFVAGVDFGDFVVWRRDGGPSYQLACVADDAAMHITEVVRGADLLKSTARQILLYRALEWTAPAWYHCRLVVDDKGRRLAKRNDALSLRTLRQRGLTPETILSAELQVEA
ncbi:MAG: tRNA glutamyl-Q synthetase, partial [Acidobacteriota bacterium]|nr:tRNA glutamyl-Q synthetase [Acidobacteriota bacterium]